MTPWTRLLHKSVAALLMPLALFAGSAFAVDLMSCRAQGVVATGCCCPPPAVVVPLDEHPRLEQGCCEGLTLGVSSEAPGPSAHGALAPIAKPLWTALPVDGFALLDDHDDVALRALRVPDATGPPLRVLHCSFLT